METAVNTELCKLYNSLTSNKLTLNISKSNNVIFHPKQKKPIYKPKICLFDKEENEYAQLESILNILEFWLIFIFLDGQFRLF